jgi:hypothetical protein
MRSEPNGWVYEIVGGRDDDRYRFVDRLLIGMGRPFARFLNNLTGGLFPVYLRFPRWTEKKASGRQEMKGLRCLFREGFMDKAPADAEGIRYLADCVSL